MDGYQRQEKTEENNTMIYKVIHSCGKEIRIFLPEQSDTGRLTVVHTALPEDTVNIWKGLKNKNFVMAAVLGLDWNRDLTPWAAPEAFRNGGAFKGGAALYLKELTEIILPDTEEFLRKEAGIEIGKRGLAGYSLGGLFSMYASVCCHTFSWIASVSGSLWYDQFTDFLTERRVSGQVGKVYLSLGAKEAHAGGIRMRTVTSCTQAVEMWLREQNIPVIFEINPGNHFYQPAARMVKGIDWLMSFTEYDNFSESLSQ